MTTVPPLRPIASACSADAVLPTKSTTAANPPPASCRAASHAAASRRIVRRAGAAAARVLALALVDLGDCRLHAVHRVRETNRRLADAAGTNDQQRVLVRHRRRLAQRAERGQARARVRRRKLRWKDAEIEEIARMRDDDVVAEAAVAREAERLRPGAQMLVPRGAQRACAAPDPWKRNAGRTKLDVRVGSRSDDLAGDLVAERARQAHCQLHPLAAAQIEVPVGDVQVAVADAGCDDAQHDLRPDEQGNLVDHPFERLAKGADTPACHHASGSFHSEDLVS